MTSQENREKQVGYNLSLRSLQLWQIQILMTPRHIK